MTQQRCKVQGNQQKATDPQTGFFNRVRKSQPSPTKNCDHRCHYYDYDYYYYYYYHLLPTSHYLLLLTACYLLVPTTTLTVASPATHKYHQYCDTTRTTEQKVNMSNMIVVLETHRGSRPLDQRKDDRHVKNLMCGDIDCHEAMCF